MNVLIKFKLFSQQTKNKSQINAIYSHKLHAIGTPMTLSQFPNLFSPTVDDFSQLSHDRSSVFFPSILRFPFPEH